ncbi:hypothetical protein QP888_08380 [Corynebacterium sp. MSK297]|uniref:hypothetical protein n=1 Tax=Corynebacterium sp. MSK297 TaxID=3050221 RepID=UPI00254AE81A|nr:hypothetical protein [Corynebacterium sp. MSK297]MDK8846504.1 hypothetical protein [Corynebacterium sp. MSK297]
MTTPASTSSRYHDVTMGTAFRAKMGDIDLARHIVTIGCLAPVYHEQLKAKLAKHDARARGQPRRQGREERATH